MDLFKRIQDLSAIYDDDGPSATVQESRPMFNERTQFDKGGVAKVKEYVQSLPKNTVVTRKLIKDFIDANDVNVNFDNLFAKNRPAYVGNFTKDKSITIDSSYPTGSKRYKKAKAIINDPKLKKEFIKFGNQKGISIKDIREKFNIGREEFYEGGLRELFNKDFQLQQASKLKPKTINNITTLLNDKEASSFLKKGQIVPDEILTKLKIAPSEAATATVRIGQIYGGNKFDEKAFKNIRTNVKASDNLFNTMNKFAFGNPYRSRLYNASLELIDEQLGNEKGTFASLKKKASYILKKNKIKGFDINEIAGVSGTAKSGAGEFSQFIDVMDSNLNQKQMASFQSAFSQARQNIANNPNNFAIESKRINKLASRFEREYGVKLPRIRDVGDVEKYYSANRLKQLNDQGLDIKKASKNVGYTIQMPKGAKTINEFIDKPDQIRLAKIGCPGKANGGRIGFDQGLNVTACATKGVEKLKGDPGKLTPGDQANVRALAKSGKAVKFLKGVLGPAAILGEVIFEGGAAANKFMDQGMPIKQALGESYINKYLLGPKLQIDVEAERAKEMAKGEEYAMAERGRRMAPFMPQSATADKNRLRDRMNAEGILTIQDAKNELKNIGDYYGRGYTPYGLNKLYEDAEMQNPGFGIEKVGPRTGKYNEEKGLQDYLNSMKMQKIADAGGVANMAGGGIAKEAGDRSGPAPESGPNSQGLQGLFNRVKNY